MKEKIIDFSKGIFAYEQAQIKTEPQELVFELGAGDQLQGSFVLSSLNGRRVKGILFHRIPGLELKTSSFFGRAVRIEFSYEPWRLRPGEELSDRIWMETDAGEYELPVKVRIRSLPEPQKAAELPLPPKKEAREERKALPKGRGQSEEWRRMRRQQATLSEFQAVLEKERRKACTPKEASKRLRELTDALRELDGESALYPLLDAYVMLLEDRREEAGWILKKYERSRFFQLRDVRLRGLFLYVNSLYRNQPETAASSVAQLQKLYQKRPEEWALTFFLLELDPKLQENARARYLVLERQFRSGVRNRLLYQEAWMLLKDDPALFNRLDGFALQTMAWAASRGLLTREAALWTASQAFRLKKWSPLASRLLKACYQISPCKETAGAVCALCIRGRRMDPEAFVWYQKGVELDAKITNLYEYFMYALPREYGRLLPRKVILYFQYHNTLTSRQRTEFYCNLARYGSRQDEACQAHWRALQEFLFRQLKERRINEDLAFLYEKCLRVETLEEELLTALADLLFLRKLTCQDGRIWQAEVSYEQLEEKLVFPLAGGSALLPVYTPGARIVLLDEQGNRYQKTVPYELARLLAEPGFLEICAAKLKNHTGLNLYLLDGRGPHRLTSENVELVRRLVNSEKLSEAYRRKLQVELLEYDRKHRRLTSLEEGLSRLEPGLLSRKDQALYIEACILLRQDERALALLEETGCQETEPRMLLRMLQRLLSGGKADRKRLLPHARRAFENGFYTEAVLELLAEEKMGSVEELLKLWKAAEPFELPLPGLEEQLLVQALFTERLTDQVFPVFLQLEDRGGSYTLCSAYLNYLGWLDFVKGREVPEGLFDSLEHHLLWEDSLAEEARLSYLRQLSLLLALTDVQKRLARELLQELFMKRRRFAFMQTLSSRLGVQMGPGDQTVVEYRCSPRHKVILHYVLEYHGKKTFDYRTEQLYPVCQGVFARAFILFYGERLTWFFTEIREGGESVSTACMTIENREEHIEGNGRYQRLCRMQRALDCRQEKQLERMMQEYEELTELVEEQFQRK